MRHRRDYRGGGRSRSRSESDRDDLPDDVLLTFKAFINSQPELDGTDPTEAQTKYEEYKRNFLDNYSKTYFAKNKTVGLLLERYHPSFVRKRYFSRVEHVKECARAFFERLGRGDLSELSLAAVSGPDEKLKTEDGQALAFNETKETTMQIPSSGIANAPYFTLDPSGLTVNLKGIPPAITRWDIEDHLKANGAYEGLVEIAMLIPALAHNNRNACIQYMTEAHRDAAADALTNSSINNEFMVNPQKQAPGDVMNVRITPTLSCCENQILADVEVSSKLIRKYDSEWMIADLVSKEHNSRHPLLDIRDRSPLLQLDLQILYLRDVHTMCFYSGSRYDTHRELVGGSGPLYIRPYRQTLPSSTQRTAWQLKLSEFQEELLNQQFAVPDEINANHPDVVAKQENVYRANTWDIDADRWRCGVCRKLFKGPEFVHKHLLNRHVDLFDDEIQKVTDDLMLQSMEQDPEAGTLWKKYHVRDRYNNKRGGPRGGYRRTGSPGYHRPYRSREYVDRDSFKEQEDTNPRRELISYDDL